MIKEPFLWLQQYEYQASALCGCRLVDDGVGAKFYMCRKHAAVDVKRNRKKNFKKVLAC